VTNVRILGEGFDFSALDYIVMADPKASVTEIVQNIGRVMRKYPGKDVGTIVVPLLSEDLRRQEAFRPVMRTARALASYDEIFSAEIHTSGLTYRSEPNLHMFRSRLGAVTTGLDRQEVNDLMTRIELQFVEMKRTHNESARLFIKFFEKHGRLPRTQRAKGVAYEEARLREWYVALYKQGRCRTLDPTLSKSVEQIIESTKPTNRMTLGQLQRRLNIRSYATLFYFIQRNKIKHVGYQDSGERRAFGQKKQIRLYDVEQVTLAYLNRP
jgi:hypothetical protein